MNPIHRIPHSPPGEYSCSDLIARYLRELSFDSVNALGKAMAVTSQIPADHDRRILAIARDTLNRQLTTDEKTALRAAARHQIRTLVR